MARQWNDPLPESSPVPLWSQVAERLRAAITAGTFVPGDVLPSEAKLNATFGISRATSRSALDSLERAGLLSRRSGKGSVVLGPRVEQPANEMSGFAEDMKRRGLKPSYLTLSAGRVRATREVGDAFGVRTGTLVFQSRRLLRGDDLPIGLAVSWLAPDILRGRQAPTADELQRGSLYEWLATRCAIRITGAKEYIEAAKVDDAMAPALQVSRGSAVLIVKRRSHQSDRSPVEYVVIYFRADRYRFSISSE